MPIGPNGQKRPADVVSNAVRVMQIATGQIAEPSAASEGKNPAAVALGRMGGKARADSLTKAERKRIAIDAAKSRWGNKK